MPPCLFVVPLGLVAGVKFHHSGRRWLGRFAVAGVALVAAGTFLPLTPELSAFAAAAQPASGAAGQTERPACCPELVEDAETGTLTIRTSGSSLAVLLGSFLLAFAHIFRLMGCVRGSAADVDLPPPCCARSTPEASSAPAS